MANRKDNKRQLTSLVGTLVGFFEGDTDGPRVPSPAKHCLELGDPLEQLPPESALQQSESAPHLSPVCAQLPVGTATGESVGSEVAGFGSEVAIDIDGKISRYVRRIANKKINHSRNHLTFGFPRSTRTGNLLPICRTLNWSARNVHPTHTTSIFMTKDMTVHHYTTSEVNHMKLNYAIVVDSDYIIVFSLFVRGGVSLYFTKRERVMI
jgi:hypothetical protein